MKEKNLHYNYHSRFKSYLILIHNRITSSFAKISTSVSDDIPNLFYLLTLMLSFSFSLFVSLSSLLRLFFLWYIFMYHITFDVLLLCVSITHKKKIAWDKRCTQWLPFIDKSSWSNEKRAIVAKSIKEIEPKHC